MTVTVSVEVNGVRVPIALEEEALLAIARALSRQHASVAVESPYMTIPEAAVYLRCSRQRIDDLLSQRRLSRVKDGRRTLIARDDVDAHLRNLIGGDA